MLGALIFFNEVEAIVSSSFGDMCVNLACFGTSCPSDCFKNWKC